MQNDNQSRENRKHPHPMMTQRDKEKYIEEFNFPYCNESSKYQQMTKIGQGTFG